MLKLTFKQTQAELMVRAASTILFNALSRADYPLVPLTEIAENSQYGFSASASLEEVGPKLVRITDLKDGGINWDTVPYCQCDDPEKYLIYPNDILFARTGATTGKTHLVKKAPHAIFASYLIRVRPKAFVLPEYLYSFFQSDNYWAQIIEEKEGSAQPNVNGQKLMNILVPMVSSEIQTAISHFLEIVRKRQDGSVEKLPELPSPLEEQRRIVARVEELAGKVEEVRSLREQTLKQTNSLIAVESTQLLKEISVNGRLSDVLHDKPRNGWSARCDNLPTGVPVLSLGAVTGFSYNQTEFKRTSEPVSLDAHYWLKPGDLLITRSNTPELVGHAAIYNGYPSPCIYPDLIMRLDVNESKAYKEFVHHWLACVPIRDYIKSRAKGTSPTMKKISQEIVMSIPFPSDLPLTEQHRIVAYLDRLQTKVDEMKRMRQQAIKELDALLPSILDKAFRGEL